MNRPALSLIAAAGFVVLAGVAHAAGPVEAVPPGTPTKSKSLREAVSRNEIVPLTSIMDWIEDRYEGQIVEVELESELGYFSYEVDLLSPAGSKIEFRFDARTGELLSVSGRDIERARRK